MGDSYPILSADSGDRAPDDEKIPWRMALLAGLPHFLIGLLSVIAMMYTFGVLDAERPLRWIQWPLLGVFAIVLVGTLVVAWRRGWPRWAAGWTPYWLALVIIPLLVAFYSPWLFFYAGPVLLVSLLYVIAQRDPFYAIIAALPMMMILWMPSSEFTDQEVRQPLWVLAWMLAALLTAVAVRSGRARRGVWLLLAFNALLGLSVIVARTYYHHVPLTGGPADEPTLMKLITRFVPTFLVTSSLILAPLLAWVLWQLGRRNGLVSQWGSRLALLGLLLIPTGYVGALLWHWEAPFLLPFPRAPLFTAVVVAGLVLYGTGILLLANRSQQILSNPLSLPPLLLAPLVFPLALLLSLVAGWRIPLVGMPVGLTWLDSGPQLAIYAVAILWLLLAGWVVTGLKVNRRVAR